MIFVDAEARFAANAPDDPDFEAACKWMAENRKPLLTNDFVLDELLTLLKMRGASERAFAVAKIFQSNPPAHVNFVSPDDFWAALEVFRRFRDKNWSFTDCVSYVVIKAFGIDTAFAFDEHFRQFGNIKVVPNQPAKKRRSSR